MKTFDITALRHYIKSIPPVNSLIIFITFSNIDQHHMEDTII
jgi:hypothetical protein